MDKGVWQLIMAPLEAWGDASHIREKIINGERREKSIKLGLLSIIYSILACVSLVLCIMGFVAAFKIKSILAMLICLLVLFIMAIYLPIQFLFRGLFYCIYQFKTNKRIIKWFSLLIFISSVCFIAYYLLSL